MHNKVKKAIKESPCKCCQGTAGSFPKKGVDVPIILKIEYILSQSIVLLVLLNLVNP
jgi:hypothetical protein